MREAFGERHLIIPHLFRLEVGVGHAVEIELAEGGVAIAHCRRGLGCPAFGMVEHDSGLWHPLRAEAVAVGHADSGVDHEHFADETLGESEIGGVFVGDFAGDGLH